MQSNQDEQIGGTYNNRVHHNGLPNESLVPVLISAGSAGGGAAGGPGMRIEGDTKDVTASQMTNNSHNEMNLNFQGHQPQSYHGNYAEQDLSKCKIHRKEDIKAFCKNCLCSICFKCLLGDHRTHDVVMLDDLQVDDLKDKVGEFHSKVELQINQLAAMRLRAWSHERIVCRHPPRQDRRNTAAAAADRGRRRGHPRDRQPDRADADG